MQYGTAAYGATAYIRGTLPYIYASPYAHDTGAAPFSDGASDFTYIPYIQTYEYINDLTKGNVFFIRTSNDEPGRV